jgi:hypothetical protein
MWGAMTDYYTKTILLIVMVGPLMAADLAFAQKRDWKNWQDCMTYCQQVRCAEGNTISHNGFCVNHVCVPECNSYHYPK